MKNWQFYRALKSRGLTAQKLAKQVGCGRSHLSQVLNNKPGRGGQTRRKLRPLLTPEEIQLLGWPLEQSSTGNIVPDAQTAAQQHRPTTP